MSTPTMKPPASKGLLTRLSQRYVAFCTKRGWLVLLAAFFASLIAVSFTIKLELRTDLAELLPESHFAVQALRRIAGRQKSATNLVLIVEGPDAAANIRFFDALKPELEKLIPSMFSEIQWKPDTEIPEHAAKWKWLYAELADLQHSDELLDRIISQRKSPLFVDLEGDPSAELKQFRKTQDEKLPAKEERSFFTRTEDGKHSLGIMMWRRRDGFGSLGDHETLKTVQQVVSRLNPSSFHPKLEVQYTGHIAMAVTEQKTIQENITYATIICVGFVLGVIYFYFRRFGLLVVIGLPTLMGVLLALMLAQLHLAYLNINTAFLVSIIIGNGINTPIVLLARYGEERRRGVDPGQSLSVALSQTMVGTGTAMLAASIAYGSLAFTDFRGFSQFGLFGGAGMILVWVSTMVVVPPMVLVGERWRPGVFTPSLNLWRVPFLLLGKGVQRWPLLTALLTIGALAWAAGPIRGYLKDPLEWNFNNLRSDSNGESQKLWDKMCAMGMGDVGAGHIGNNGVLLVDTPDQAEPVAEALRKQDAALGDKRVLSVVRTLTSVLPKQQEEKLALLAEIRKKLDRHRDLMSDEEWKDLLEFRPPDYLRKLGPEDLPRMVREAFTEVDGQQGRLIGIDSLPGSYEGWNGRDLIRFAKSLKVEALGRTWVAASAESVFSGMVEAIYRDGPIVTKVALCGVIGLVLVMFGVRGSPPVLLSLFIGIVWWGGLLGYLSLKLNFMNFVTLPITLGVGADYAANTWARLREDGPDAIAEVIADTGSAVALCSLTTIIGYSTLLLASNRALRSFGLAADLGEVTCLVSALVVLPVIARVFLRARK
ncbi:MAG: MMPL family transporter [Myxococcales bacterium]|nr:MMPL family transporter [Myxococcales bacterium]